MMKQKNFDITFFITLEFGDWLKKNLTFSMFCYRSFGKLLAQDRQPISKTAPPKADRWWAVRDSNPQPTGCRPVALTN